MTKLDVPIKYAPDHSIAVLADQDSRGDHLHLPSVNEEKILRGLMILVHESAKQAMQDNLHMLDELTNEESSKRVQTHKIYLRGTVPEVDQKKMTFQLHQIYGSDLTCSIQDQHREIIMDAFNEYKNNARILIEGIGLYTGRNTLQSVKLIDCVRILDPLDVPARLDKLRNMGDSWLDGDGLTPSHAGLDWLTNVFNKFYAKDLPLPHTYPTLEGGIQMEWSRSDNSVILEIDIQNHSAECFSFSRYSDVLEFTLNLDVPDHWQRLATEIQNRIKNNE